MSENRPPPTTPGIDRGEVPACPGLPVGAGTLPGPDLVRADEVEGALAFLGRLPFPVLWIGGGHEVRWLNRAAADAYRPSGGETCFALSHGYAEPCPAEGEVCAKRAAEETGTAVSVDHVHRTAAGYALFKITAIPVAGGGVLELHASMGKASVADSLTGAYSRHCFELLAGRQLGLLRRMGKSCTFVLADLDQLKEINDAHGHAAGDAALVAFTRAMTLAIRGTDTVGRLGGDEFCLVLPGTGEGDARVLLERVRQAIRVACLPDPFAAVRITGSFGLHTVRPGEGLEAALAEADRALYAAKSGGRDRIETR